MYFMSNENNHIAMEEDYKQQREALLARLAHAEQSYKENLGRAVKIKAKADALGRNVRKRTAI